MYMCHLTTSLVLNVAFALFSVVFAFTIDMYLPCAHLSGRIFKEMDTSGDQRLDFEEFRQTLLQLDKKLKSLPATAQVASQQVNVT